MRVHKNKTKYFSELRKKAEENIITNDAKSGKRIVTAIEHELEVHSTELEMQNEELLATESKLIGSIEEYANLFDYAPVGYFIQDISGIIVNVNKTGSCLLGFSKKHLIGKHLSVFLTSKTYQDNYYMHRNYVIETGKSQHFECEINKSEGSVFFALIESAIVKDEKNNFKHFLTTINDITVQKEQEFKIDLLLIKEMKLNQMKSQFINNASHEFRTPLATILTSAELIEKYTNPDDIEKRSKHLNKIISSASRLNEILMSFIAFNEIKKGTYKNEPETFDIVEFTENFIEETRSANEEHIVKYNHQGKYKEVYLDKLILKECMSTLIFDAFKYSPNGGEIEIKTEQNVAGNVNITIKDHGIGIPEYDQNRIFEKFFRATNAYNIQGTGLGLNITKKLINLMGGTINFESKENVGTAFTINFKKTNE